MMQIRDRAWQLPLRLASGGFVLDSGLGKRNADEATAQHLHGLASAAYPFLAKIDPTVFTRSLAAGEVLLGAVVLTPLVPGAVAGMGLLGFGAGLLGLYARTPGMHREGSPFPTPAGLALAKDAWLAAIGAALVLGTRRRPRHSD